MKTRNEITAELTRLLEHAKGMNFLEPSYDLLHGRIEALKWVISTENQYPIIDDLTE